MKHSGIWMPIEVLHDDNLTHTERYLLMDIISLDKLDKGCIASNEYFSELIKMQKSHISRSLSSLAAKGYISIEIKEGSRNHQRVIKMVFEGYQNGNKGLPKCEETKETKSKTKTYTPYEQFLFDLKKKVLYPSKVTSSKKGKEFFKDIQDTNQLMDDYTKYQADKKEYAKRITDYMEDYTATPQEQIGGVTW